MKKMFLPVFRRRLILSPVSLMIMLEASIMFLIAGSQSRAEEAIDQEEPTPSSVYENTTSIERSFIERLPRLGLFPRIKEPLKEAPPFFRDTKRDQGLFLRYLTVIIPIFPVVASPRHEARVRHYGLILSSLFIAGVL
ncbi:MAG: hypothetical protein HS132_13755 [Planctomycetia bacterium]|nr:hypothetical protein [Planctomycetia bacterium]